MEILSSAAGNLLSSVIRDLILDIKGKTKYGIKNQVEKSRRLVEELRSILLEADSNSRHGDNGLHPRVSDLREIVYDMEAAIATYEFEVDSRPTKFFYPKFGSEMKKICERIATLPKFPEMMTPIARRSAGRKTFGRPNNCDIVGFEKYIEDLVEHLTNEGNPYRVFAICAMGGLGKTTLAREVYNHLKVRSYFNCFGWVYVSQDYQVSEIHKDLLIDLVSADEQQRLNISNMNGNQIVNRLHDIQKDKKCLLVLDDVWSSESWEDLSYVLAKDATDTKILLTTRNKHVALRTFPGEVFIHEPQCLDDDKSWMLLQKKVSFMSNNQSDLEYHIKKLREFKEELLEYCAGLPFAISILGGLLSSEIRTINDWNKLRRNIKKYLNEGIDGEVNGVSMMLKLSYDALPYHLKQCFLFLAHFPKNIRIKVEDLCQMWIAEDFMLLVKNEEDDADACFCRLADRYMVQIREVNSFGEPKTCGIHDLTRDFCLLRAKEENFLQVFGLRNGERQNTVDSISCGHSIRSENPPYKIHRLAIHLNYNINDELRPIIKGKDLSLRSFICFNRLQNSSYGANTLKSLLKRFHLLRILKLENSSRGMVVLPEEIGHLVHLRILSLYDSLVKMLPSSVGNLRRLQSLDLRINWPIKLPNVMWKLEELRLLYLPDAFHDSDTRLRFSDANSLQTLVNILISTQFCNVNELVKLTKLVKLKIFVDETFQELIFPVNFAFEHLQSLVIKATPEFNAVDVDVTPLISICPSILKLRVELPTQVLPENLPNLIKLTLRRTSLANDPMETLRKLPNLRILVLDSDAFEGTEMACVEGGFPELKSLSLINLVSLNNWIMEEGAMPTLCHLHIENCRTLTALPDGLSSINSLDKLISKRMPSEFNRRIRSGGEEFHKVQHVACIEVLLPYI